MPGRASLLRVSRLPNGEPEIFASIQGEGVTCGVPSIFVRLAVCNLRCQWCDSAYTWDWTRYDQLAEITNLQTAAVAQRVVELAGPLRSGPTPAMDRGADAPLLLGEGGDESASPRRHARNVVITGGEPLLQQRALVTLACALETRGFRIEVETNGTVRPQAGLAAHVDQWNVSPKLASSGNRAAARNVAAALTWFATCPHAYFKFVVVNPDDVDEVDAVAAGYRIPIDRILLMPEGTTREALEERSSWLAECCQERGYRFSPRLHILLWGDERGR